VCQEERLFSHLTQKQREDRYDMNQLRTEPWYQTRMRGGDQDVMVSSVESGRDIE